VFLSTRVLVGKSKLISSHNTKTLQHNSAQIEEQGTRIGEIRSLSQLQHPNTPTRFFESVLVFLSTRVLVGKSKLISNQNTKTLQHNCAQIEEQGKRGG